MRLGFYGDPSDSGKAKDGVTVAGARAKAEVKVNAWIAKDKGQVADYLSGTIGKLEGAERCTSTPGACLNITDMEVDADAAPVALGVLAATD